MQISVLSTESLCGEVEVRFMIRDHHFRAMFEISLHSRDWKKLQKSLQHNTRNVHYGGHDSIRILDDELQFVRKRRCVCTLEGLDYWLDEFKTFVNTVVNMIE